MDEDKLLFLEECTECGVWYPREEMTWDEDERIICQGCAPRRYSW
jgi:hypothetical protein